MSHYRLARAAGLAILIGAAIGPAHAHLISNSAGINGAGVNGAGINGAGINGAGINGAGINGAGINGAGINGLFTTGSAIDDLNGLAIEDVSLPAASQR